MDIFRFEKIDENYYHSHRGFNHSNLLKREEIFHKEIIFPLQKKVFLDQTFFIPNQTTKYLHQLGHKELDHKFHRGNLLRRMWVEHKSLPLSHHYLNWVPSNISFPTYVVAYEKDNDNTFKVKS